MSQQFCERAEETMSETYYPIYGVVGFLGIVVNSMVILLIIVTKQLRIQSIRLLMYLSCVDVFTSLVTLLRAFGVFPGFKHNCLLLATYYFFILLSGYMTFFLFALTGLDRYLRIKYLEEYSNVFTKKRFDFVMVLYVIVSLTQTIVTGVLNTQNYVGYAFKYTVPVNILVFITVFIFYFLSISKLREYQNAGTNISEATKSIMKITKVYLYLFAFTFGMLVVFQTLHTVIVSTRIQTQIFKNLFGLWPSIMGIINGIAFIIINPPTRNLISRIQFDGRCCHRGHEVNPDVELNVFPPVELSVIREIDGT